MTLQLKRYWFEFELENAFNSPAGIGLGCGVTAYDYDDAVSLMDQKIFVELPRPPLKNYIENVDIRTLDQGHVVPNMHAPVGRGIWFPMGYEY
jgi:hypothetical protein